MGRCSRPTCKFSHGDAGGGGAGGGYGGGGSGYGGGDRGGGGAAPQEEGPVVQCDAKCVERGCDNSRIYISGLAPSVTSEDLQARLSCRKKVAALL